MPRHQRLRHDQFVFQQLRQVKRTAECQHIVLRVGIEIGRGRFVLHKTDGPRHLDRQFNRMQATLAFPGESAAHFDVQPALGMAHALWDQAPLHAPLNRRQRAQIGLGKQSFAQALEAGNGKMTFKHLTRINEGPHIQFLGHKATWFHALKCRSTPKPDDNVHMANVEKPAHTLVLGSTSPYRKELLSRLRIPFICQSPRVDESPLPEERPAEMAQRLALAKARDVAQQLTQQSPNPIWVIGSDQVADLNGEPIGKPGDHPRAMAQLRRMRGKTVLFHTAVAVCHPSSQFERVETSVAKVSMRPDLSDAELDQYLRLEQPYDCAGSAKVESLGIALLDRVESDDPTALIGLPLILTISLLRAAGFPFFDAIVS